MPRKLEDVLARRRKIRNVRCELISFMDEAANLKDIISCSHLALTSTELPQYSKVLSVLPYIQRQSLDRLEEFVVAVLKELDSLC